VDLNQSEFYKSADVNLINKFQESTKSKLNVHIDINRNEANVQEWVDMMLFSLPYIMKALEKPNRVIIAEEEIVKVELIKKVTVETVKHLAKNTNLITDIEEETEEVKPVKLLNVFREEDYLTYENKFIYSLIRLMQDFISYKKKRGLEDITDINLRTITYEGKAKVGEEKINVKTDISVIKGEDPKDQAELVQKRLAQIAYIEEKIGELTTMEMYKKIDTKKITLTTSPLKMTNVLLKNVNFQYAVKLWNFLNDNFNDKANKFKEKKDYEDKGLLSTLYNETFLLNYLNFDLVKTKDFRHNLTEVSEQDLSKKITEMLMMRILELNPTMTEAELKELLAENFIKVKSKYSSSTKQIEDVFSRNLKEFVEKISSKR